MPLDVEKIQDGCVKGCLIYAALCVLGALSMFLVGDQIDGRGVTFDNRTGRVLFVAVEGSRKFGGRLRLEAGRLARLRPFRGDLAGVGEKRIGLFRAKDALTPFATLRLDERTLETLDQGKAEIQVEARPRHAIHAIHAIHVRIAYDR